MIANPPFRMGTYNNGQPYVAARGRYAPRSRVEDRLRGEAGSPPGDHEKAIADYSEAIRLRPANPLLYSSRAKVYRSMGDDANADRDEKTAESLSK